MANAADAARELERTVTEYGFKGAMINGTIDGQFLDHPRFEPLLDKAEKLGVPLYLHPAYPVPSVGNIYYKGEFSDLISNTLSTTIAGWHWEVALHTLRMIVSGVFDRHPNLQIIIGHLGEMIPFFWERIEFWLEPRAKELNSACSRIFFPQYSCHHEWVRHQSALRARLEGIWRRPTYLFRGLPIQPN